MNDRILIEIFRNAAAWPSSRRGLSSVRLAVAISLFCVFAQGQGVLMVTPGPRASTVAGTGVTGLSGDGGWAALATFASPSAIAYDVAGNLYVSDALNHVVREVSTSGQITTVAGNGLEGYSGDGGSATAASLDTPVGVAVDASGILYIADSHNHRIRKVAGGIITSIAGTGVAGFSGDGGSALSAQLSLPSAIAVDGSGSLYIADTNNQRIRKIVGTTITTIAGTGEETFAGDGAAATSAALDSPLGIAVDSAGRVYIADRHNQRIRVVGSGGMMTTLAGDGAVGFSGDGGSGTAAALARPSGVSVDAAGNVYIADSQNQRIREVVADGTIASVAGSGQQGYGGDGAVLTSADLDSPTASSVDATGHLIIADKGNERIRAGSPALLTFATTAIGNVSPVLTFQLANTGSASLSANLALTGSFSAVTGGTCPVSPVVLAAGASCTQNLAFVPAAPGVAGGTAVLSGAGLLQDTLALSATGTQAQTTMMLGSNANTLVLGQTVTLTASVDPAGPDIPTGSVTFFEGGVAMGAPVALGGNGSASFAMATLPLGSSVLTATYSGDTNFSATSSAQIGEMVEDFNFTSIGVPQNQSVAWGQPAMFTFQIAPVSGPFNFPMTLSASGLPPGATATFSPQSLSLGSSPGSFTMTVKLPILAQQERSPAWGGGAILAALLLLPFGRLTAKNGGAGLIALVVLLSLGGALGLTGCLLTPNGTTFGAQTYLIHVTGNAIGANGATLQRSTTASLTVQ